jgi:type III pantothenate kinase
LQILVLSLKILTLALLITPLEIRAMEDLVIKIGNSHIVAAFFENDCIKDKLRLSYRDNWQEKLKQKISANRKIVHAFIGSVNGKAEKDVELLLSDSLKQIKSVIIEKLPFKFQVKDPSKVGVDILANCTAAIKLYPNQNLIIVDMGTALTITALSFDRVLLGVSILPGIEMNAKSLNKMTDKLPLILTKKTDLPIACTTEEAIQSGLYYSLIGSIRYISNLIEEKIFKTKAYIIATGGLTNPYMALDGFNPETNIAFDIQKDLNKIPNLKIEHDLTLVGMHEILKKQLH